MAMLLTRTDFHPRRATVAGSRTSFNLSIENRRTQLKHYRKLIIATEHYICKHIVIVAMSVLFTQTLWIIVTKLFLKKMMGIILADCNGLFFCLACRTHLNMSSCVTNS